MLGISAMDGIIVIGYFNRQIEAGRVVPAAEAMRRARRKARRR